jgi:two-component system chemotaxis sensor kinase CheA
MPEAERQRLCDALPDAAGVFQIHFLPPDDSFRRGLDPIALLGVLREEATLFGTALLLDGLPPLDELDPETCNIGFQTLALSEQSEADLRDVFDLYADDGIIEIEPVNAAALLAMVPKEGITMPETAETEPKRLGEILVEEGLVKPEDVRRALAKQAVLTGGDAGDDGRIIRVKQARLDGLINLVGELVTARNAMLHLERFVEAGSYDSGLSRRMKETTTLVNKAAGQLQTDVLSLRMVPVHTVFQRLPRVVRDVAVRGGKQVDLRFSGDNTELDKTVADALFDPLVHLVRNAADHGIESPDVRRAAGKSEVGHLDIGAWREGNEVVVEVRDDGAGVDRARVIAAAVAKGMVDAKRAAHLSDADALDLMFIGGLSTAREVSDISGRGVGLDAVRNSLARIGGSVHATSVLGQGMTMRLHLPLTISLFRALIVRAGGGVFALPLDAVRATAAIDPTRCQSIQGRPVANIRGNLTGLVALTAVLEVPGTDSQSSDGLDHDWQAVVMDADGQSIGLLIDALDPPQEIMVKPVDAYLAAGGVIAGAAVLGDGRVALVLEPAALAAAALAHARRQGRGVSAVGVE